MCPHTVLGHGGGVLSYRNSKTFMNCLCFKYILLWVQLIIILYSVSANFSWYLLIFNSVLTISFFLRDTVKKIIGFTSIKWDWHSIKQKMNDCRLCRKLLLAHGKIVFKITVTQLQLKALERRFIFQILSQD